MCLQFMFTFWGGLIDQEDENLKQDSIQARAWLLLAAFNKIFKIWSLARKEEHVNLKPYKI